VAGEHPAAFAGSEACHPNSPRTAGRLSTFARGYFRMLTFPLLLLIVSGHWPDPIIPDTASCELLAETPNGKSEVIFPNEVFALT